MAENSTPPAEEAVPDLRSFQANNPETVLAASADGVEIQQPWGEASLTFHVPNNARPLVEALNTVRLPPALSAIWHIPTRDLEFVYVAMNPDDELRRREFTFSFDGSFFRCDFGDCSDTLCLLANAYRSEGPPSPSGLRNLSTIRSFLRYTATATQAGRVVKAKLTSFWIRDVRVPEGKLPTLARHLNFAMAYYDRDSPQIIIHEDPSPSTPGAIKIRYPLGAFPSNLAIKSLDPFLLALWESAVQAPDPIRQFLYSYQIIEYAAFYYLKDELTRTVRRILSTPNLADRTDEASRQLLEVISEDKTNDEAKLIAVVQQAVDPLTLWGEIEPRAAFFSLPTEFEGGFSVPPLIRREWTAEDFRAAWIPKLPDTMRKLRNGIVHAREQRQARCVMPTRRNQGEMQPWASVARTVASQIVIYESA